MKYSAHEIKVGFVVVTAIVLLAMFIIALTGSKFWVETITYTTSFYMSAGLEPGDEVRYGGMRVGKITQVYIAPDDPRRIEVVLTISKNTPVRQDSMAYISYIGLLGKYYVEISAGASFKLTDQSLAKLENEGMPADVLTSLRNLKDHGFVREDYFLASIKGKIGEETLTAYQPLIVKYASADFNEIPLLEPGSVLPSRDIIQFSEMMDRVDSISGIIEHMFMIIDENVTLIMSDATNVLSNVNELIGSVNQEKIRSILDNVDQIITTNAETINGILENLRSMLGQVDALSGSLNTVIVENEPQIQATITLLQSLMQSGEAAIGNLNDLIGLSKDDIELLVNNAAGMSQRLTEIVAEIHQNKAHINNMLQNLDTFREPACANLRRWKPEIMSN